jgi:hypothetical protein
MKGFLMFFPFALFIVAASLSIYAGWKMAMLKDAPTRLVVLELIVFFTFAIAGIMSYPKGSVMGLEFVVVALLSTAMTLGAGFLLGMTCYEKNGTS